MDASSSLVVLGLHTWLLFLSECSSLDVRLASNNIDGESLTSSGLACLEAELCGWEVFCLLFLIIINTKAVVGIAFDGHEGTGLEQQHSQQFRLWQMDCWSLQAVLTAPVLLSASQ